MKNLIKVLGIIAMFAVIGLGSCEVDPEDQVQITITGIPAAADGLYAFFALSSSTSLDKLDALSDSNNKIASGKLTTLMVDDKNKAFGKEGSYYIIIFIHDNVITSSNLNITKYTFMNFSKKPITKGPNSFAAIDFKTPDQSATMADAFKTADEIAKEKVATFLGNYSVKYWNMAADASDTTGRKELTEKINLTTDTRFYIEDDSAGTGANKDYLEFTITKWNESTTPDAYKAAYPNAFKFEGKIVTQKGFCGNDSQTGKGISATEAPGLECTMYLYFSDDGKFVRTPFTKKGATTEDTSIVVNYTTGTGANAPRVYTKQQ